MAKAVFRPSELVSVTEKVFIDSPTSYHELAHYAAVEEVEEDLGSVEEYLGPTADDLRREAEMFRTQWEEEKERMSASAKAEAENIVSDAQRAAFAEVKRQTDEAQVIKQRAEEEAQRIISEAQIRANEIEIEIRQSLEAERNEAREQGRVEGRESGYSDGKAEVDRLIERTQVVLERAQNKRGEILSETEKEIVDLVLLISRKVIKVISEHQHDVVVYNVIEALRKVKSKGTVIIRVNLADLKLATEHKQDFINVMEGAQSVQVVEDSSVDSGGCIIETDFGEIDARIASQLAELESKILEISPIRSRIKSNTPPPVVRTANLNAELAAATSMLGFSEQAAEEKQPVQEEEPDDEMSQGASAALTASAALAALATMATKGKREADKKIAEKMESVTTRRRSD
jgi:flagellar assembly protein FliH